MTENERYKRDDQGLLICPHCGAKTTPEYIIVPNLTCWDCGKPMTRELTLDDVRHDQGVMYLVAVHCADCDALILSGKKMTGTDMAKDWLQIVASSPLAAPQCPNGCRSTYSDCNANTKLKITRAT